MATKTEEDAGNYSFGDWKNQNDPRVKFITKVYMILTIQTFLYTFLSIISIMYDGINQFQINNTWIFILSLLVFISCLIISKCYDNIFHNTPLSYFLLLFFTIALSYLTSYICVFSRPNFVIMLFFMTFALNCALTLFCEISKKELSTYGSMFFCSCISIILFLLFLFMTDNPPSLILISSLWVIIYGMYIIYDSLLILGNRDDNLSCYEYIKVTFLFYTDIFTIFTSMFLFLKLLKEEKQDQQ
jgi:FtsH-binding integral membrane protein